MKTVALYRPSVLENALSGFDRYLDSFLGDRFFNPPEMFNTDSPSTRLPPVDIKETEKAYILEAELPGFDEKDIEVRMDGNILIVESKKTEDKKEESAGKYLVRERHYSSFSRSFRLPENADPQGMRPGRLSMRANLMHDDGYKGEGVLVAVLDTGVWWSHPAFEGAFYTIAEMQARGANVTNADGIAINNDGKLYYVGRNYFRGDNENPANNPNEVVPGIPINISPISTAGNTHGTHVSGTIVGRNAGASTALLGIAPEAKLIVYRMLNNTVGGSWVTGGSTTAALERTVVDKVDVVNMSFGSTGANQATAATSRAINNIMLANPNIVFVSSAGNSGSAMYTLTSPGPGSTYISSANVSVGANANTGAYTVSPSGWSLASGSSRGPSAISFEINPDLGAHGSTVLSARPIFTPTTTAYGSSSGTSMASPHIAGAVALLIQYSRENGGQWTAAEVKTRLMNNAIPYGTANIGPYDTGAGYVDVYAAAYNDTVVSVNWDRVSVATTFSAANWRTTRLGSFSFGNVGTMTTTGEIPLLSTTNQNVRTLAADIKNTSDITRTYTIQEVFRNNPNSAATVTFSTRRLTVEPGQTAVFYATMSVRGTVAIGHYDGYVQVREDGNLIARLPFALTNTNGTNVPTVSAVTVPASLLSFNLGGAEAPIAIDPINVIHGVNILTHLTRYHRGFPAGGPEKEGRYFAGWYLDAGFTIPLTSATVMPSAATVLYACFADPISKITLNVNALLSIPKGQHHNITFEVAPNDLAILKDAAGNYMVTWKSSNTDVVTIDGNGRLVAVGVGNSVITLTIETGYGPVSTVFMARVN